MLHELAPGVYVATGYEGGNIGLIQTPRGAVLVDTPMLPAEAQQWQETLRQLGVESIYCIINTDFHPERFLGNAWFMPTRIWSHASALKTITKYKTSLEQTTATPEEQDSSLPPDIWAKNEVYLPELYVGDHATLHLGERRIELLHLDGHTPASLGVYLPQERVLFAGDNVVRNEHPVMAQANSLAWLETLQRIRELDVEYIVPGAGEPAGKELLDPLEHYIREMRQRVETLFQSGASRRECVDKVGLLDYFPFSEDQASRMKRRRRENVERVYAEIRTAQARARR